MAHKLIIQSNLHLEVEYRDKARPRRAVGLSFSRLRSYLGSDCHQQKLELIREMPCCEQKHWHSSNIESSPMSEVDALILAIDNGSNPGRNQTGPAQELLRQRTTKRRYSARQCKSS